MSSSYQEIPVLRSKVSIVEITDPCYKNPPKTISFYFVGSKITPGDVLATFRFGNLCGFWSRTS